MKKVRRKEKDKVGVGQGIHFSNGAGISGL